MAKETLPVKKDETLFQLVQLSHQIQQALVESMGELTPDIEKAIAKIHDALPNKADNYKFFIDDLKSQADVMNERAAVFIKISKSMLNYIDSLKYYLKMNIINLGEEELVGTHWKWKLVNNAASLIVDDEKLVPAKFKEIVQVTKIRSDLIKEALKAGEIVPGTRLESGSHVRSFPLTKAK